MAMATATASLRGASTCYPEAPPAPPLGNTTFLIPGLQGLGMWIVLLIMSEPEIA